MFYKGDSVYLYIVDFGSEFNNIQIDGISFIEHISFKAFNEGVRLKDCIHLQQQLTG